MQVYLDIINHFGYRNQMKKLNEEVFEFLEAVDNYEDELAFHFIGDKVGENFLRDAMIEEMGDVLILLTEFIAKYKIEKEELDVYMDYKLDRTLNRIKSGYYDKKEEE